MAWTIARQVRVSIFPAKVIRFVSRDCAVVVIRTCTGWLVTEVPRLVSLKQTAWLRSGSWTSGQLFVELYDILHAHSVLGSADALFSISNARASILSFLRRALS